jgi:phosphatidyl-myo-inositol dimannoside synthase
VAANERLSRPRADMERAGGVLLLAPSGGQGGGIERYVETLEWAFAARGVECARINLRQAGALGQARMLAEAREHLRMKAASTRLVVAHRALLPMASWLARSPVACGISIICHGNDVWAARPRARRSVENYLMRKPDVRVVAASSFTAGALSGVCQATVLSPGLSQKWYDTLAGAAGRRGCEPGIHLVTTFRLDQWRGKGLPELLAAISALRRSDIRLTVCGIGAPSADLEELVARNGWCSLRPGLTDSELARQLADADLFVLATRTRGGPSASGEGFGLALAEAQVAGTPVVGPAFAGARDAYVDRVTGVAPIDESAISLAKVLGQLLEDPDLLTQMGKRAGEWARETFCPSHYASHAVARLL